MLKLSTSLSVYRLLKARVLKPAPPPSTLPWCTVDAEIKGPAGGSPGLSGFPLSKPVVGPNIAFACCACLQGFYPPS